MKKALFYSLLSLCLTVCAVSFTSCSDSDDDETNYYSIGIQETSVSGDFTFALSDMSKVEAKLKAEFGDLSFSQTGNSDKLDKEMTNRFDKATQNITLSGGWNGHFTYGITRTSSKGGSKYLTGKTFNSPDNQ